MLSPLQQHCLKHMGIRLWSNRESQIIEPESDLPTEQPQAESRQPTELKTQSPVTKQPISPKDDVPLALDSFEQTITSIKACQRCELAQNCTQKVPGKGNPQADLMIIGEAPGRDEDLQGLPFVGRAGQLLDRMLQAIDLNSDDVYITNILKCRPPNNRDPLPEEAAACSAFLNAQIGFIQPKIILSVGRISAHNLLREQSPLGQLRTREHQLPDSTIPLQVTYHPAYLLRNPDQKSKVWEDLKKLRRSLDL